VNPEVRPTNTAGQDQIDDFRACALRVHDLQDGLEDGVLEDLGPANDCLAIETLLDVEHEFKSILVLLRQDQLHSRRLAR